MKINQGNKLNVLIVDDEFRSRNVLQSMIEKYCNDVTVIGQAHSVESAQILIDLKSPDLVLLDIEMPNANGFELLNKPSKNYEVVFVSAFDHFAVKSIQYHALDYLLKPIDIKELQNAIEKAKAIKSNKILAEDPKSNESLNRKYSSKEMILFLSQNGENYVSVNDVLHCKADGPCSWIHLTNGKKFYVSKSLGQIESKLNGFPNASFIRVHHSHVVNLFRVLSFYFNKNYIVLEDKTIIKIAQRRKKAIKEMLSNNKVLL